jgi:hypothetical protein
MVAIIFIATMRVKIKKREKSLEIRNLLILQISSDT